MKTYLSFYKNEIRAVQIYIRDQDDVDFIPDGTSTYTVVAPSGTVIPEVVAMVSGSSLTGLIDLNVTYLPGTYDIIWKIMKGSYIYYHKTDLQVLDL
jgi:hypothetical protein